jgi:hypothetical protein
MNKKKPNYWVSAERKPTWDWDPTDEESYDYGFTKRNKKTVQRILVGDYILRYWEGKGHKTFLGLLEVTHPYYYEGGDGFPCKIDCKCVAQLKPEASIPIHAIMRQLTFYNRIQKSSRTLGNYLMPSPKKWNALDGKVVEKAIREAETTTTGQLESSPPTEPPGVVSGPGRRRDTIASVRKYGFGGEGKDHRDLKEWISKHPKFLGLTDTNGVEVEYGFISGDSADLVFARHSGIYTVVEVETTTPLPGAHQAIKYKALLCAEKGLPLDSNKVESVLVAWSIPLGVKHFCKKYGVQWREYKK